MVIVRMGNSVQSMVFAFLSITVSRAWIVPEAMFVDRIVICLKLESYPFRPEITA
jgi:hypothetical protein